MWETLEHRHLDRQLGKAPREVLRRYEKWKDIAQLSGPGGLWLIAGFHDDALSGQWKDYRSSRFGDQWRVIYRVVAADVAFCIEVVTPHDYRRPK